MHLVGGRLGSSLHEQLLLLLGDAQCLVGRKREREVFAVLAHGQQVGQLLPCVQHPSLSEGGWTRTKVYATRELCP